MSRLVRLLKVALVSAAAVVVVATVPRTPVHANTTPKVMLAYDSENVSGGQTGDLYAVERLLTTAGVRIQTVNIANYRRGMLSRGHYDGVVTLINWPQLRLTNQSFMRDRDQFTGVRVHLGPNVTANEAQAAGVTLRTVYRQQFILHDAQSNTQQLLPFSADQQVIASTTAGSTTLGTLTRQNGTTQYPFAAVHGQTAVMPYFTTSGMNIMLAEEMFAAVWGRHTTSAPLLTITGVTPYTNMRVLRQLATYLQNRGINFAVSVAGVYTNTDLPELDRYARTLRAVELAGGVVLLHNLAVGDPGNSSASRQALRNHTQAMVTALANRGVLPVGMSVEAYWNQDAVLRTDGLSQPQTVVLMGNEQTVVNVDHDGRGRTFANAYYALPGRKLTSTKMGSALAKSSLQFALPTAITFGLPDSGRGLSDLERTISRFNGSWQSPAASWRTQFTVGSTTIAYNHGQWQLNGQAQSITAGQSASAGATTPAKPREAWYNRYFQLQSTVMWVFFGVTLTIMLVFIAVGRSIYRRMYRRKGDEPHHHS